MLLSASFAAVVETGNWTATESGSNAITDAATRCGPGVQEVYACSGGFVKAVSSDGSIFYKADGSTVNCPNAAPAQIGAECVHLLMPNYCPTPVSCEAAQNQSAPVSVPGAVAGNVTNASSQAQSPALTATKPPSTPIVTAKKDDIVLPAPAPRAADFSMDNLALVVLLLGAVSVGVLFTMFKNSITE